jgi:NitT/TauT family transport system permease protein
MTGKAPSARAGIVDALVARIEESVRANSFQIVLSALSTVAFVVLWWLYSAWLHADWPFSGTPSGAAEYIPYPWEVLAAFVRSFTVPDPANGLLMTSHIYSSMKRIFLGFVLSVAIALPAGLLFGRIRGAEAVGRPVVEIFRPIPPLAWIPIFLIVFGITFGPIAIVFLGIFFPILLNTVFGAKNVDPILVDAARTLGSKRGHIFIKVVLPYTFPYAMTGIKVGLGIGWMCIVAAEMLGAVGGGVGYYIFSSAGIGRYDYMYAGMLVIGILSVLTTGVAGVIERRLYKWMGMG